MNMEWNKFQWAASMSVRRFLLVMLTALLTGSLYIPDPVSPEPRPVSVTPVLDAVVWAVICDDSELKPEED